jgi:hypothetical protein
MDRRGAGAYVESSKANHAAGIQSGPVHPIGVDMKPDWKDAPEWAKWLAMDYDGAWFWYADKPRLDPDGWAQTSELYKCAFAPAPWKCSLQKRPDDAPNPTP